ncbi:unnamed protein product, partial [Brassica oleracea]
MIRGHVTSSMMKMFYDIYWKSKKIRRRTVLHVELIEYVSQNQSNEMFSRDEEIISDARANDDMIGLKELTTIPHIQEDENEKGDEVGTERDDMEKL